MSEGKLRIQADRAAKAEALLNNSLLQEAFADIEDKLNKLWKDTTAEEMQRRDDIWRSQKLLQSLQSYMTQIITAGKAAEKQLIKIQKPPFLKRIA